MAKDVKFNIKLAIDGKEQIVTASTNSKELARQLSLAKTNTAKFRDELLTINQGVQAIQNVTLSLQQVSSVLSQFSSAYDIQQEAETKLASNMRNTMAARDEDIRSIYDLCAAQQQLGVIGDEVQLNGAQELATYLEKKSSLEKLIPVMNDMLAQQYGLNATSEAAANIATMMGKVMDGQVGALKRYGYRFDEAQEQILKFGEEEERAAVLAEVVSASVGGMNARLAQTDAGRAKQAANNFGDLKEQAGQAIQPIRSVLDKITQGAFAIASLSMAANGLKGAIVTFRNLSLATRAADAAFEALVVEERVLMATSKATGIAVDTLKVAVRGLMIAGGVTAAIAALTWVVEKLSNKASGTADDLRDLRQATSDEDSTAQQTAATLRLNIEKLKEFQGTKQQEKKLVDEMNSTYGDAMGYYSSVADWYKALTRNSEDYCRQMVVEARMRDLANQIAANEPEIKKLEDQINSGALRTTRTVGSDDWVDQEGRFHEGNKQEVVDTRQEDEAIKKLIELRLQTGKLTDDMREAAREAASIKMPSMGSPTPPPTPTPTPSPSPSSDPTKAPAPEGSQKWYDAEIKTQQARLEVETDPAKFREIEKRIEELSRMKAVVGLELNTDKMDADEARAVQALKTYAGDIPKEEIQQKMQGAFQLPDLAGQDAMKKFEERIKGLEGIQNVAGGVQSLTSAFGQLTEGSKATAAALAGVSTAAALASLIAGFVKKLNESTVTIWDWIAAGLSGTATVVSMASQLKGIGAFADGGVVSGPTLALVGEYAGASTNPEVIAPLDKLRSMLNPPVTAGSFRFRVVGRDLVAVMENNDAIGSMSGRQLRIH